MEGCRLSDGFTAPGLNNKEEFKQKNVTDIDGDCFHNVDIKGWKKHLPGIYI